MIINGKQIAEEIVSNLKKEPKIKKFLGAFLVGENLTSLSFLKQKEKIAQLLNVDFRLYKFPEEISQDALRKEMLRIVNHKTCGGALVQLPLPNHINKYYVLNVIPREKDVDVLGERALGAFYNGRNLILPPAVGVVDKLLKFMNYELNTKKVVVIGAGFLIGKPIITWFQNKVAELTIFNEFTQDLRHKLKNADLIITGVGKANLFSVEDLSENSMVIDFGYDMSADGKIFGDFNSSSVHNYKFIINYTPTPGGTGPILVAQLFENFYKLNQSN